jgi:hypothetical protein
MKKFISAVLGLAAGMSATFGQGYIQFNSLNGHAGDGVWTTFGTGVNGHPAGYGLSPDWTAGLLYSSTSPITEAATASSADAAASLNPAWSIASNTAVYQSSAGGLWGFYQGPMFMLADAIDGQVVYFQVIAFETGAAGADSAQKYASSIIRGHSASFSGVLHPLQGPVGYIEDNMQPFSVFTIPEPSTLALAGLALAALVAYSRKHGWKI